MDQLPRLGKRELICLLLFTCNYVVSVWRGFLFLRVLGMDCVILLWHSLGLPYNYFVALKNPSFICNQILFLYQVGVYRPLVLWFNFYCWYLQFLSETFTTTTIRAVITVLGWLFSSSEFYTNTPLNEALSYPEFLPACSLFQQSLMRLTQVGLAVLGNVCSPRLVLGELDYFGAFPRTLAFQCQKLSILR